MTRAGRKPLGPALAENLEGSARAKKRLEIILKTIAGRLSIEEASHQLGIEHSMLYKLRTGALEAALASLEPQPMGRPPTRDAAADLEIAGLNRRIKELEKEAKLSKVREEIVGAGVRCEASDALVKKTAKDGR